MRKHVTIKDIARELGLSTSTVSRALAGSSDINPQTRELIIDKAKNLNYHPNPMAVGLITRRSRTIGLVIPEFQNTFFPNIIIGIQRILNEAGYQLLIMQSNESPHTEAENLRLLERYMVDGIIISVTSDSEDNIPLYQGIIDSGIPMAFFNRVCDRIDSPKVIVDNRMMSFWAVEHLIYSGYRRIAHLSGPRGLTATNERREGYLHALTKHGLEPDERLLVEAGIMIDNGMEAMNRMLEDEVIPDAVFAFNDPVAIGAMKAIRNRGLRIPDDIAMVGFSESRSAKIVEPNLTSVAQPLIEMGETVARLILQQAAGEKVDTRPIVLDAVLNIRESSRRD